MGDQIRVALAETPMEADIMVEALRSEGIPAMTRSTGVGALPLGGGVIGSLEIVVLKEHAERAYEILHPEE